MQGGELFNAGAGSSCKVCAHAMSLTMAKSGTILRPQCALDTCCRRHQFNETMKSVYSPVSLLVRRSEMMRDDPGLINCAIL